MGFSRQTRHQSAAAAMIATSYTLIPRAKAEQSAEGRPGTPAGRSTTPSTCGTGLSPAARCVLWGAATVHFTPPKEGRGAVGVQAHCFVS